MSPRPNVVLMLADNVGWGDIGAYSSGEVRGMPTPNIDRIAAEGLQLTHFLTEPGCTPARAALLLGRYSIRAGLGTIIIGGGTPNTLQADEVTLAELFKSRGYTTGMTGKWHLGSEEQNWPTRQGFDEYHVGVIESLNSVIRKAIKNRRIFPSDRSALKVVFLAIEQAAKKWTMPVADWKKALNRFAIQFEDRLPS